MSAASRNGFPGWWFRSLAVWGLVSYLGGMGWLMTLCTAALAVVDGEHSVRIESRRQGFFVILGHDRSGRAHPAHSHEWLATLLTSMASDSLTAGDDHVIDLDRDPGLVSRPVGPSLRDSIPRNTVGLGLPWIPKSAVAPGASPCRPTPHGVPAALPPSLRVSRTHVLRC
ncbi:MAG: hypothetical protein RIT19_804 [Verrucomicrobiota bacterium]|jgi:hypothetical protein